MSKVNSLMDWDALLSRLVHPTQVAVIETLRWIGRPLSAAELTGVFEDTFGLSTVSYHMRRLRDLAILELVDMRPVRGARETFYFFAGAKIAGAAKRAW